LNLDESQYVSIKGESSYMSTLDIEKHNTKGYLYQKHKICASNKVDRLIFVKKDKVTSRNREFVDALTPN